MKITYVSHACLFIETEDLKIATDPWWNGAAYCNQWHVFPRPVNAELVQQADAILISHGHEDHLHEATLRLLPKEAQVRYPYHFFGGAKQYLESLGFGDVKEAVTFRKYKLSPKTCVTYVINGHDSIMVIESGGKVLINVNDALHSSPEKVIDFYVQELKARWSKIDYVFCGFGGASYFPNTMHLVGKDDREIGVVREQLFAHNFCRVVSGLKPKIAVPFAADFALLRKEQRWINDIRFPREQMSEYYQKHFGAADYQPKIYAMYSGDRINNGELETLSPYRKQLKADGQIEDLLDEQYPHEVGEVNQTAFIDESEAAKIIDEIKRNLEIRRMLYQPAKMEKLKFAVHLTDVERANIYNVSFVNNQPQVERDSAVRDDSLLTMRLTSEILRHSLSSDWGADAISIGYVAEIEFSNEKLAEIDLENVCLSLLSCYPTPKGTLKKAPLRSLEFFFSSGHKYARSLKTLRKLNSESENYDREIWLLKNAAEIRRIYDLPQ